MKAVAFICKFKWVGISTSVINSAIFWESKGYNVAIYCENPDLQKFPIPDFGEKNIKWIITKIYRKKIVDDIYFRIKFFNKCKYTWIIGFDNQGIIRAAIASFGKKTKLIYHSLEFFEPPKKSFKGKIIKWFERLSAQKSRYIFTQDDFRTQFLKSDLKQKSDKFKIIYNSTFGSINKESLNYFRNIFNIPDSKIIVLCVGSIIKEHYISELINSVDSWGNEFVLVLHGWIPKNEFTEYVKKKIESNLNKIFLSEKLLDLNKKDIIFQSCDIGFVGFLPTNNNYQFAAGSAGKIFDFLKSSKPILAFNTPGMKEIIENNNVGVVFSSPTEISQSLSRIKKEYDIYKNNTEDCFYKYDFMIQYDKVFRILISKE